MDAAPAPRRAAPPILFSLSGADRRMTDGATILDRRDAVAGPPARQHFLTLDGLRGVAAIAVLLYHRRGWIGPEALGHGYLAVDFFFVLSGFVIGYAYEQRLRSGRLGFGHFVRLRIIRLVPLLALGALLGTGALILNAIEHRWLGGVAKAILAFPLAALALPAPPQLVRAPFSTNPPSWSLFFEICANLAYAAVVRWLSDRVLAAVLILSALALVAVACAYGGVAVGWQGATLAVGFVRIACPFAAGVLLFRLRTRGLLPRMGCPAWLLAIVLAAIFAVPLLAPAWNTAFDLAASLLVLPAIVAAGSLHEPSGRWLPLVALSAELSYPVYILHYPLLELLGELGDALSLSRGMQLVLTVAIILPLSLLAARRFDEPLRASLRSRFQGRRARMRKAG